MIEKIYHAIAHKIENRPRLVAAIFGVMILISLIGMTHVTMATGSETYLDRDSQSGRIFFHYIDTFSADNLVIIIEADNVMSPPVMDYIDRLSKNIKQQQYIWNIDSAVDLYRGVNNGNIPTSPEEVDALSSKLPKEILSKYTPAGSMTLVRITLDQGIPDSKSKATLANVEAIVRDSSPPPGVTATVTGNPAFQSQMRQQLSGSMGSLILIAMILMVVVMGLLFSYVNHRFLPVLIVFIGLILTFGFMGIVGIQVNTAVIGAFPVLIGLGIDYAIQFQSRLEEEARKCSTLASAVTITIKKTGPAVLYAMLATSMGFIAMQVSEVPMIRTFGIVSMIGVMLCYVTSLIVIPVFAILIKYKPKGKKFKEGEGQGEVGSYNKLLATTAVKIARNPIPVILIAGIFACAGLYLDGLIPVDTSEKAFVPPDMPAKVTLDKVTRAVGSTDSMPIYVYGDGITELDTIQWIDKFSNYEITNHNDKFIAATSIVTYIKSYNSGKLPETQQELDAALNSIPASIKDHYLKGGSETIIEFFTTNMDMSVESSVKDLVYADLKQIQPPIGVQAKITGNFDLFTSLISGLTKSKETMTFLGFGLVLGFLLLIYRKIQAASPIIPIIFIVGWNAVAMYTLGINYSPMTATLGSMTIGVAAEYTILIMERYLEEREKTDDPVEAIRESVQRIGSAITVSGLATFFGFSALIFSSFNIISNFGITTVIAVGFSLLGAIIVMPAIIPIIDNLAIKIEQRWGRKRKNLI